MILWQLSLETESRVCHESKLKQPLHGRYCGIKLKEADQKHKKVNKYKQQLTLGRFTKKCLKLQRL